VFLLDVLEHLPKEPGQALLQECERVARQQIVLFTPLGFLSQEYADAEEDAWGFHGGQWQRHLSGWVPEDLDDAWTVLACRHFHATNGRGNRLDPPAGAFWAIKNLSPSSASDPSSGPRAVHPQICYLQNELATALLEVQKKENQLSAQRSRLAERDATLAAQAHTVCTLTSTIETLQRSIQGIQGSLAWRITQSMSRLWHGLLLQRLQSVGRFLARRMI
jgi:hypothetical protein